LNMQSQGDDDDSVKSRYSFTGTGAQESYQESSVPTTRKEQQDEDTCFDQDRSSKRQKTQELQVDGEKEASAQSRSQNDDFSDDDPDYIYEEDIMDDDVSSSPEGLLEWADCEEVEKKELKKLLLPASEEVNLVMEGQQILAKSRLHTNTNDIPQQISIEMQGNNIDGSTSATSLVTGSSDNYMSVQKWVQRDLWNRLKLIVSNSQMNYGGPINMLFRKMFPLLGSNMGKWEIQLKLIIRKKLNQKRNNVIGQLRQKFMSMCQRM